MFDALGLASFAKTSGSKGLQVYAPLNSDVTFAQTKPFARQVAGRFECTEPDLVVSRQAKALSPGTVLIDWSQNDQHKTTVCVYSLRARERPTVSTPVEWDEVRAALASSEHDLAFDAVEVLDRVSRRGDLLAPVLSLVQVLPPAPPAKRAGNIGQRTPAGHAPGCLRGGATMSARAGAIAKRLALFTSHVRKNMLGQREGVARGHGRSRALPSSKRSTILAGPGPSMRPASRPHPTRKRLGAVFSQGW
jgi:hypothetical protein